MWFKPCCLFAFVLSLAVSARADFVSGRVYDPEGKILPNTAFTVEAEKGQGTTFKTDGAGNFSVYLDPGTYTVYSNTDRNMKGIIHGYPQAAQEDVHLISRK
jgi:hypothetical protein